MTPFFEWRDAPPGDFAVIGDPVSHSLSPQMQSAAFSARGEAYSYHAIRVVPGEVAPAIERLRSLGYRGLNVTIPHKAEARRAMQQVDEFAARCDAVNTIRLSDLYGINTDGGGFLDTLSEEKVGSALILGAGGSARAIALSLTLDGWDLRLYNRTTDRAILLVRELDIDATVLKQSDAAGVDLIVNATSASLHGELPLASFEGVLPSALAYDLVYGETPFLRAAADAGLRTMDGKPLLVAQGARSLEFWLPGVAPRGAMVEAIR